MPPLMPTTLTVVVADDNALATDSLCMLLESYGFTAVPAYERCEAQKLVEALAPAVLISDIEMPGQSGIELAQALQEHDSSSRPAMIAISGRDTVAEEALSAGFDRFIAKPADPKRLVSLVLELLDPARRGWALPPCAGMC